MFNEWILVQVISFFNVKTATIIFFKVDHGPSRGMIPTQLGLVEWLIKELQ